MIQLIKNIISSETTTSSRRFILITTLGVSILVNISIIVLSFLVCFRNTIDHTDVIQVLNVLVKLTIVLMVFILLLAGIITWQNINETIQSVKDIPAAAQELKTTIETGQTQITTKIQPAGTETAAG